MQNNMVAQVYFMQDVQALLKARRKVEAVELLMKRTGASPKTCEDMLAQVAAISLKEALPAAVESLVEQGKPVEAAQLLSMHTGLSLKSCLKAVEELKQQKQRDFSRGTAPQGVLGLTYTNGTLSLIRYDAGAGERSVTPAETTEWRQVQEQYQQQLSSISPTTRGLPQQELAAPEPPPQPQPAPKPRRLLPWGVVLLLLLAAGLVVLLWWVMGKG